MKKDDFRLQLESLQATASQKRYRPLRKVEALLKDPPDARKTHPRLEGIKGANQLPVKHSSPSRSQTLIHSGLSRRPTSPASDLVRTVRPRRLAYRDVENRFTP